MKKMFLTLTALAIMASAGVSAETQAKATDEPQSSSLVGTVCKEVAGITSPAGKEIRLSEVVAANRYTLLDFWASWCPPCMGEVPYMKAAYDRFHDKGFEIYGVSYDTDSMAWQGAIRDKKLDWVQVSSLAGWKCPTQKLYGVGSIPTNYLIDKEGRIVAENLRGEALADKLAELLR